LSLAYVSLVVILDRNLIGDHKALTEACLPKVEYLWVHDIDEEEEQTDRFIDPWFSCKLKTENMK
jgi:hypothetical protein